MPGALFGTTSQKVGIRETPKQTLQKQFFRFSKALCFVHDPQGQSQGHVNIYQGLWFACVFLLPHVESYAYENKLSLFSNLFVPIVLVIIV